MNLRNKKELAAKTFRVGKDRVVFVKERLEEIKEALTRRDMRDLKEDNAILIKTRKGRKKVERRKRKKGPGKIKKKANKRKQEYVKLTRKLRAYVSELKKQKVLNAEEIKDIRNKIRNRVFKSKSHLQQYVRGLKKWKFRKEGGEKIKQIT